MHFATDMGNVWFGWADRRVIIFGPKTSVEKQMWPPAELRRIKQRWMERQCAKPGLADSKRLKTLYSAERPSTIHPVAFALKTLTAMYVLCGAVVSLY
jgi:hypothetical protein